ncbi:hypothetical protein [Bacillus gaemokensis]|uniref:Uncharacterized protein n=1 Tax=Bacillus gaemokensis TaxID=574375 RepID=A0A073K642_9BACI|nr:hypothetical protein [Bacillus gaemokensis]KEK21986.1 hypothetical protein BAGA_22915 [Bacillus gaemokensis]KYG38429.1 hypothetical protein AZF08_19060 [Bacillus gaemokensis]
MNEFIRSLIEMIKVIGFYVFGVIVTVYILEPVYNLADVAFQGNVWVICVAVAFILFTVLF